MEKINFLIFWVSKFGQYDSRWPCRKLMPSLGVLWVSWLDDGRSISLPWTFADTVHWLPFWPRHSYRLQNLHWKTKWPWILSLNGLSFLRKNCCPGSILNLSGIILVIREFFLQEFHSWSLNWINCERFKLAEESKVFGSTGMSCHNQACNSSPLALSSKGSILLSRDFSEASTSLHNFQIITFIPCPIANKINVTPNVSDCQKNCT